MARKQVLQCVTHGPDQLGYVLCVHVRDNPAMPVAHHLAPQLDELGEIFCHDCLMMAQLPELHAELFQVHTVFACEKCALKICAGRLSA